MHSGDGRQPGVQQAPSVQEGTAALAAEGDQGQGTVVCGRFKPAPDGGGMEQNERESPSKMTRQAAVDLVCSGWRPTCQPKHCWQQAKCCAHPMSGQAGHLSVTAAVLLVGRVRQKSMSHESCSGVMACCVVGCHRCFGKGQTMSPTPAGTGHCSIHAKLVGQSFSVW